MYEPSRETDTERAYLNRAKGRLNAFLAETGVDWDLHEERFLEWLEGYRNTISTASWRQNRAALAWYMESVAKESALAELIKAIGTDGCSKASRTSAKKKKSLSLDEWHALSTELLQAHERHLTRNGSEDESVPMATLLFLSVTETTGLRPSEWWGTTLYEETKKNAAGEDIDIIRLRVKNGKATNGRSFGEYRTLRFPGLEKERKLALLRHYRSVKRLPSKEAFDTYQKACTARMTYTTSKLWPSRKRKPSLYSGRHQVSANLKKERVPLVVLAAIMGHGTDRTATEHYGRKQYGRGNESGIQASEDDVSKIRQVANSEFMKTPVSNKTGQQPGH